MIDRMDTDKDGQLSERELFVALHHPEVGVRDIVSRMIVKHESENADRGKGYDDVAGVTSVVNGGDMGLEERRTAYKLCEKVFL